MPDNPQTNDAEETQDNAATDENDGKQGAESADDAAPNLDPQDPDAAELSEARSALEKEETGDEGEAAAGAGGEGDGDKGAAPATEEAPAGEAEARTEAGEVATIPKPRFDEVNAAKDKASQAALYWRGRHDAVAALVGKGQGNAADGGQGEATPTPEERIGALRAGKQDLAMKYDDGEITFAQYEDGKDKLEDGILAIRQEASAAATAKANADKQPPAARPEDYRLQELTAELEAKHPYTTLITEDHHWDFLLREAAASLNAEGVVLPEGDLPPVEMMKLRTRVAELATKHGEVLTGKTIQAEGQSGKDGNDGKGSQAGEKPGGLSKQAAERLAKLRAAGEAPTDIQQLGGGAGAGEYTEADIQRMSDEEIAALPAPVRRKFMPDDAAA